jgi:hypothetical protein
MGAISLYTWIAKYLLTSRWESLSHTGFGLAWMQNLFASKAKKHHPLRAFHLEKRDGKMGREFLFPSTYKQF